MSALADDLAAIEWTDLPNSAHKDHRFDAQCAVCSGDLDRIAEVLREHFARMMFDQVYRRQGFSWEEAAGMRDDHMREDYRNLADNALRYRKPARS